MRTFDRWLDPERDGAWAAGLELAQRSGPAMGPLLRRMRDRASDHRRRNLLLGAVVAAEGEAAADLLLELGRPRRSTDSQIRQRLAAAYLAHQLPPAAIDPAHWLPIVLDRSEEPAVRICAAFAIGRGEEIDDAAAGRLDVADDPGIAAAFGLVFGGIDRPWSARWFAEGGEHVMLVRRGMFLGATGAGFEERRVARVVEALEVGGDPGRPLRLAAGASLLGAREPERWLERLGRPLAPELLAVLALDPGFGPLLATEGLLNPAPNWLAPVVRRRMALAMAEWLDPAGLRKLGDVPGRDDQVGPVLCLGVAARLLRRPVGVVGDEAKAWIRVLPARPELEWVRIAGGLPLSVERPGFDDRPLDRAYRQFVAGGAEALPRDAQRAAVAAALARLGARPGALRRELEDELLWDLVLRGSEHGIAVGARGVVTGEEYLAGGLAAGDGSYQVLGALDAWFRDRRLR